ncbi:hypothetical protein AB0C76_38090 [Kitasatospora sp. NPDC048722]|uniref:hypothetical protein n=1 Tax=Kitasatospora sp. NPDC048722 TaxID=3155639 RepID=UPI0033D8BB9D
MTDELSFESAETGGGGRAACPRCEETTRITVFREWHRPVARGHGVLRCLIAVALFLVGAKPHDGSPATNAVLLALSGLFTVSSVRAMKQATSGGPIDVVYCHHCTARTRTTP